MADIFRKVDLQGLLRFKYVAMFGCSNMRALYKDLVCLWNSGTLLKPANLKTKLEQSFMGDRKKKGDSLFNGRNFEEEREFKEDGAHIEFYFITKCYTDNMERFFTEIKNDQSKAPDVIILSSALWDITRWGPNGVVDYRDNMVKLMESMKRSLPKNTLVIWLTELPVSNTCYGGLFVKQVEFMKHFLRFEVMEANLFARQLVVSFGFDVLDVHYYLRMQIHLRAKDGIHWLPVPLRYITNLTLTHIALSWNRTLPGNFQGPSLDRMKYIFNCDKTLDVPSTSVPTDIHDVLSKKSEQFASVSVCSAKKKKKRRKRAITNRKKGTSIVNEVNRQHLTSIQVTIYNSIANKRACNSVHSGAPVQSIKKKQKKNPKKSTTRKKQYEADSTQSLLCNADNSSIFNLGSSMRGETALETEYWRDYDGCFPMPHSLNYINFTADFFNEDSITNFQSYDTHMSYGKEVVGPDRHLRNSLRKWRHSPYHGTYFQ